MRDRGNVASLIMTALQGGDGVRHRSPEAAAVRPDRQKPGEQEPSQAAAAEVRRTCGDREELQTGNWTCSNFNETFHLSSHSFKLNQLKNFCCEQGLGVRAEKNPCISDTIETRYC